MTESHLTKGAITLLTAGVLWVAATLVSLQTAVGMQEVHIRNIIQIQTNLVVSVARINGLEVSLQNLVKGQDRLLGKFE